MIDSIPLLRSHVRFLSVKEAQTQISTSDVYTQNLSRFDLQAKIRTLGSVDEGLYLENARNYVRAWSNDDISYLADLITRIDKTSTELELNFPLPDEILLIKTSGWEEGAANGYTRANAIYLNENSLSYGLLLHELFHIMSRHDATLATDAYGILKFQPCSDIAYTDELRISNPDAPHLRHFVTLRRGAMPFDAVLIMRAARSYSGGGFFSYVQKRLLVVEGNANTKTVKLVNGAPVFLEFPHASDLYTAIGRNTEYNIHQEEVTAVHFALAMTQKTGLPNQELVTALSRILQKPR